jgi:Tfp pilus assembly protein PilN
MINLLPPELKQEYRYARYNRKLLYWTVAFIFTIGGVAIITGAGVVYMNNSINSYRVHTATTQSELAKQNINGIQKEVSETSGNLNLMVQVLSKEILFSKLLDRLASITPPNVALTNLTISQDESAIQITAKSKNYDAATQLQVNIADPSNQIFSKADIVNISCASGSEVTDKTYPCTVGIKALFTKNSPFLFINSGSQKGNS